ncbi:MAG: type II secretion system F family protein [Myxococcales bacterium]
MAEFVWEARARTGEVRRGNMSAESTDAVEQRLRAQQLTPVSVKRKAQAFKLQLGTGVGVKELVTFTRLFATMIDAGVPLVQCLEILSSQQSNKYFGDTLRDIKNSVEQGSTFSDALRRHPRVFDELFVNLVQAGELGGILDTIMNRLSVYIEKRQKLIRQVRGALTYPTIVVCIAALLLVVMLTFVIPAFESMFKDFGGKGGLPKLTQLMIAISHGFVSYLPLIVVVVGGAAFAVIYSYRQPKGRLFYHKTFFQLPIIGPVLRKLAVARFTRTLGTLLQSGVPILDSLEICAKSSGNLVMEAAILYVRQKISEGKNMGEPLAETKVFPDMVVQMISVGEQTGALDQMLNKVADFYEEETDIAVASLTSAIEPLLMVGVGGIVGIVMVSMYLPIFSMAGNIKAD